jgi:hypothetical protein
MSNLIERVIEKQSKRGRERYKAGMAERVGQLGVELGRGGMPQWITNQDDADLLESRCPQELNAWRRAAAARAAAVARGADSKETMRLWKPIEETMAALKRAWARVKG